MTELVGFIHAVDINTIIWLIRKHEQLAAPGALELDTGELLAVG
jgi:hypothetical protein